VHGSKKRASAASGAKSSSRAIVATDRLRARTVDDAHAARAEALQEGELAEPLGKRLGNRGVGATRQAELAKQSDPRAQHRRLAGMFDADALERRLAPLLEGVQPRKMLLQQRLDRDRISARRAPDDVALDDLGSLGAWTLLRPRRPEPPATMMDPGWIRPRSTQTLLSPRNAAATAG
jgi:hypothetical protein